MHQQKVLNLTRVMMDDDDDRGWWMDGGWWMVDDDDDDARWTRPNQTFGYFEVLLSTLRYFWVL